MLAAGPTGCTRQMLNILASAGDALFYLRMKILRQFNHAFIWALGLFLGCVSQPHAASGVSSRNSKEVLVYFGTYTGGKSKGIYVARFNPANGKLGAPELAAETVSPSFLAVDPGRRFLYAANEIEKFNGKPGGAMRRFEQRHGVPEFGDDGVRQRQRAVVGLPPRHV